MLSHCLLNQNSISDGTADFLSQFNEIIEFLMTNYIGMIQLPCPELICLGLDRRDTHGVKRPLLDENTRIRELLSETENVQLLQQKTEEVVMQIQEYQKYGFQVVVSKRPQKMEQKYKEKVYSWKFFRKRWPRKGSRYE
jgi:predicted secreted protein